MVENKVEIKDFQYWPGTLKLDLPRTIDVGQKIHIDYVPLAPVVAPVVASDSVDPTVPKEGTKVLSPEETAFLADVGPVLTARCSSCHNGRPFNTSSATIFASAKSFKAEILDRIGRANAAAGVMPQGGWPGGSDADKAKLVAYFSK